ncbi:Sodium nucleoside protein [Mycena venus]|uniref:Protein HRI1 n=1 Tax=Mycena venus TaxID=2733690 RepID=A0A8H6TZF6_9AGAR|nr:Sodium nucleoside protein [Mycena venus]
MPAASISFRESIRWIPDDASEPTRTIVLTSLKTGVFLDVRFDKESSNLDWAFAGYRSSLEPNFTKFTHHIDSRTLAPLDVLDIGTNTPLQNGTTLEAGEMVNPATGILTPYQEIWRDEECDDAVFVRNVAGSIWRARAGPWQLALGRTAQGVFWAWQAHKSGSGEDGWTRGLSTLLGAAMVFLTPRTLCGPSIPTTHRFTLPRAFLFCIPRNNTDAECPLTNRPLDGNGHYMNSFTFPDPALVAPGGFDPRIMVLLVVGDYNTFSGTKTGSGVLKVYTLEANLGIYTAPGTKPAYITVETAQYAVVVPDPTVEVDKTPLASDPSTPIQCFAMDVDPCTGAVSERNLFLAEPAGAAPVGKTIFQLGNPDAWPTTRQVGFRYANGIAEGPRGIIAGQFFQPIFTFLFRELIVFGSNEPANQFELIPFLAGPLEFGKFLADPLLTPTIVCQLSPWPGAIMPGTTSCAPIVSTSVSASSTPTASSGPIDVIEILAASLRNQKEMTTTTDCTNDQFDRPALHAGYWRG